MQVQPERGCYRVIHGFVNQWTLEVFVKRRAKKIHFLFVLEAFPALAFSPCLELIMVSTPNSTTTEEFYSPAAGKTPPPTAGIAFKSSDLEKLADSASICSVTQGETVSEGSPVGMRLLQGETDSFVDEYADLRAKLNHFEANLAANDDKNHQETRNHMDKNTEFLAECVGSVGEEVKKLVATTEAIGDATDKKKYHSLMKKYEARLKENAELKKKATESSLLIANYRAENKQLRDLLERTSTNKPRWQIP